MTLTYDYVQAIEYIKERWGYIRISCRSLERNPEPKIIQPNPPQENFWPILDFGNELISSAGLYYYGNVAGQPRLLGTIEEQGRQTSRKMVTTMGQRGVVKGLHIEQSRSAARHLQFAAWIKAKELGIGNDFAPKPDDELSAKKIEERLNLVGKRLQKPPTAEAS